MKTLFTVLIAFFACLSATSQTLDAFITTWKTDNPGTSSDTQITIPTTGSGYNYSVTWEEVGNASNTGSAGPFTGDGTVTFPSAGTYRVSLTGQFPRIYFNNGGDKEKILSVDQWGNQNWSSMANAFYGCSYLNGFAMDVPSLMLVSDMSGMFRGASSFHGELSMWDVSSVTNMSNMFRDAFMFNSFIANWNVSQVTDMSHMFHGAMSFGQFLDSWDVSNVTNMSHMFHGTMSFNIFLFSWDVSSVTDMSGMFQESNFNQHIGLQLWDVSSVTNMSAMFADAFLIDSDLSAWDVSQVTDMSYMFKGMQNPINLTGWNVSSVVDMSYMFSNSSQFTPDVSNWNMSSVMNMEGMFQGASNFNQSLGGWDVSNVSNMSLMFDFSGLSTDNYYQTLLGWSQLPSLQPGITLGVGGLSFCDPSVRDLMIGTHGWTIVGDSPGIDCPVVLDDPASFITTWKTDNPGTSSDTQITIPTTGSGYDYTVTWVNATDGNINGIAGPFTGDATIAFPTSGTYQVAVDGDFPRIYFNNGGDKEKILSVDQWGDQLWSSMEGAYYGCSNIGIPAVDAPNLSNAANLANMLRNASSFNDQVNHWDVSTITQMRYLFSGALSFNQPLSNWNVSQVTSMQYMFSQASAFNQSVESWDVGSVSLMTGMFWGATAFNQPLNTWDVTSATDMYGMFSWSSFNQPLASWDVSNVSNMASMFENASFFNQDLSAWNVANVTNMMRMFSGASAFDQPLTNWNVSNVTSMYEMFKGTSAFNQSLSSWDVGNVTSVAGMFRSTTSFDQPLDMWDVSSVTDMSYMFYGADRFNRPIDTWNTQNVIYMVSMFQDASVYDQTMGSWDVGNVVNMNNMLRSSAISQLNYDNILSGWSQLPSLESNVQLGATDLSYCDQTARDILTNTYGWTITGDSPATNCPVVLDDPASFITTWRTDNPGTSATNQITIPTTGSGYNYTVTWVDTTDATINGNSGPFTGDATITFPSAGTYRVAIDGDFPWIFFNNVGDKEKILSVDQWGDNQWSNMYAAFSGCSNLTVPAIDAPDLGNVTSLAQMFRGASSFNEPINHWNVSTITSMSYTFHGATSFNQPLGNWDVSNVSNMSRMFHSATSFNADIGSWDVSSLTTMLEMFRNATSFNSDLNTWDVSNVTNMNATFYGATSFNKPIYGWHLSNVTSTQNMFYGAISFDQDISTWNVSNVTNMAGMFRSASSFNQDIGSWDLGNVTKTSKMFFNAVSFNQPIANWSVGNVIHMNEMFRGASSFDQNIDGWDVSRVTNMAGIFRQAGFNHPIGNWDVSSVTDMNHMFFDNESFNQDISGWNLSSCTNTAAMFYLAEAFNQDVSGWDVSNVTDMNRMFLQAYAFDQNLGSWDISNVSNLDNIFKQSGISAVNYDATLAGWISLPVVPSNLTMTSSQVSYCDQSARDILVNTYNWNITGDSPATNCPVVLNDPTSFITTWKTDNPGTSSDTQITIPTTGSGYNYTVTWVDTTDGNVNGTAGPFTGDATIAFPASGIYQVAIDGDFPRIYFNDSGDKEKIISIDQWGDQVWSSMRMAFFGCANLSIPASDTPDLSQVTDLHHMFRGASSLNDDLSAWDVSNVWLFNYMFAEATSFNQPLDSWDVSNATDMYAMFQGATSFNQPLSSWDVSQVTKMDNMFMGASSFSQDLSGWQVGNVQTMTHMFYDAIAFNSDISGWDVSSVSDMRVMFYGAILFDQPIGSWQVGRVTDMDHLFWGASSFNQSLANWDVSSATDMSHMFQGASSFNQPIGSWNVSQVTKMDNMFMGASSFSQDLSGWQVGNVQTMTHMFYNAILFNSDISGWDVGNVTNLRVMFYGAASFNQPIGIWDVSRVTDMDHLFWGASSFDQPLANWNVSSVTDMSHMFHGATSFNQPIGSWDVSQVTKMDNMFMEASSFSQDLSGWQVGNVQTMTHMFYNALVFNSDLNGWDVSKVTEMRAMFSGASFFNQPLYSWDVSNVTTLDHLFWRATSFNQSLATWDLSNVTDMSLMFNQSGLSPFNYNATLQGWSQLPTLQPNVNLGATGLAYCDQAARDILTNTHGWTISGDTYTTDCPLVLNDLSTFITTWKTDNPGTSATNQITIPTTGPGYNYTVTWVDIADGNINGTAGPFTEDATITFPAAGIYQVSLRGDFPRIYFNNGGDKEKILSVDQWGDQVWSSMQSAFWGCSNLVVAAIDAPDLSQVGSTLNMFRHASSLTGDLSAWDVSNVTSMQEMFRNATVFNGDISSWDVSNVTNMYAIFYKAYLFDQNLGTWNIGNVSNLQYALDDSNLSPYNYNETLKGWSNLPSLASNVLLTAVGLNYCDVVARSVLTSNFNWTISGDVEISNCSIPVANPRPFITTWKTDNPGTSATNQITIPTTGPGYSYTVTWVDTTDGNIHGTEGPYAGDATITFPSVGTYQVSIAGEFPRIYFNTEGDKDKILAVDQWGDNNWESMADAFEGCSNIVVNATDAPNLAQVFDASHMFRYATSVSGDFSAWDVSNITSMREMFRNATAFNGEVGSWNVGKVTDMYAMFYKCPSFNQPIGSWDVSSVADMRYFLQEASSFSQDLSSWDVSSVTDMADMFNGSALFNSDLSSWDVSSVTDMSRMFRKASTFDSDLSSWDVSQVTSMHEMFREASLFNSNLNSWDVGNVTSLHAMFYDATSFNSNLSSWDVSNVTDFAWIFGRSSLNSDLSSWNTGAGTTMKGMFYENSVFNQDLSGWNVSSVTDMSDMFREASNFNSDLSSWDVSQVTNMREMFRGAALFNSTLDNWEVGNVTDMHAMFYDASAFNQDLNSWDVSKVTSFAWLFGGSSTFNGDVSSWNTSSATTMQGMFYPNSAFNQDISNWDVSNVTNMHELFRGASSFDSDIGSWDVSNVRTMYGMFYQASVFNHDLSTWDVTSVENMRYMFYQASAFDHDMSSWDITTVSDMHLSFSYSGLSSYNYNATLQGWSQLPSLQQNVALGATGLSYCDQSARDVLTNTHGWTIGGDTYTTDCPLVLDDPSTFITTWKTDNPGTSATNQITIPATVSGYNYMVEWVDTNNGNIYGSAGPFVGEATLTFPSAGTYQISVSGDFPRIFFNNSGDKEKILSIDQWGDQVWNTMNSAFHGCSNLTSNANDSPNLASVSDLSKMFFLASNFNGNLNGWDVSNVTNMTLMFGSASSFNQDIGNWEVGAVTNMASMFNGAASFNPNINNWDVGSVTDMSNMFNDATAFNQDIGAWNVGNVTNMRSMFEGALSFNQPLNTWDVSNATSMYAMFYSASSFNQNLSNWDVSSVTNMTSMFHGATVFNQDLSGWNVSSVSEMSWMFAFASSFNQPLNGWDVSSVVNMYGMFTSSSFNQPIGDWDVSNVQNLGNMFRNTTFDQNISNWDVGNATTMRYMFLSAEAFNQDISSWNVSNLTDMKQMFDGATNFNQNLGAWDISQVTTLEDAFNGTNMSQENYNNTLTGWAALPAVQQGVELGASGLEYCASSARNRLVFDYQWQIIGDVLGTNCEPIPIPLDESFSHTPAYNGNISAIRWSSYANAEEQIYSYAYDELDRLTKAMQQSASGAANGYFAIPSITYDLNGNIESLTRQGVRKTGQLDVIDQLDYSYEENSNRLLQVNDNRGSDGFTNGYEAGDDYTYDAIGNLTADKNKGITNISYNILDLPEEITFADGTVIRNTYLANGTRIKQELFENGTGSPATKTTDYEGRLLYEDNSLALAHHAEGRAVPKRNSSTGEIEAWDYQYHLTDHQGNTRVTVSATPENYTLVETFETDAPEGSGGFQALQRLTNLNANTTTFEDGTSGDEVQLLQVGQTGAMALLIVDPRDTIQLSVQANYEVAPSGNSHVPIGFSALFGSFDAIYGGAEGIASQASDFSNALSGAEMVGKGSASTAPRAFVNYIFFDTTMAYVTAGFKQISTAAQGVGVHELVELDEPFIADQQGYVLVYLSNENQEAVNIHFDDFTVYHGKTNVVQSQDYYPFGGSFNAFTRTATRPNEYLYNGGVELNEKTNYYETAFRQYDPLIGRFTAIDPLASQFSSWTPYQYAFNDPIYYNDPLGLAPYGALSDDPNNRGGGGAGNDAGNRGSGIGGWSGFSSSFGNAHWLAGAVGASYSQRAQSAWNVWTINEMVSDSWGATPLNGFSYTAYNNQNIVSHVSTDTYAGTGDGLGNGRIWTESGSYTFGSGHGTSIFSGPGWTRQKRLIAQSYMYVASLGGGLFGSYPDMYTLDQVLGLYGMPGRESQLFPALDGSSLAKKLVDAYISINSPANKVGTGLTVVDEIAKAFIPNNPYSYDDVRGSDLLKFHSNLIFIEMDLEMAISQIDADLDKIEYSEFTHHQILNLNIDKLDKQDMLYPVQLELDKIEKYLMRK